VTTGFNEQCRDLLAGFDHAKRNPIGRVSLCSPPPSHTIPDVRSASGGFSQNLGVADGTLASRSGPPESESTGIALRPYHANLLAVGRFLPLLGGVIEKNLSRVTAVGFHGTQSHDVPKPTPKSTSSTDNPDRTSRRSGRSFSIRAIGERGGCGYPLDSCTDSPSGAFPRTRRNLALSRATRISDVVKRSDFLFVCRRTRFRKQCHVLYHFHLITVDKGMHKLVDVEVLLLGNWDQ